MSTLNPCRLLFCLLLLAGLNQSVWAQFGDLIKRVPERANTLILIDVDQLHNSPLARAEGWREQHERRFAAGLSMVPPQSSKFVMAAQIDFEFMQPMWETALLDVKYEPSIPEIATKLGGSVDEISGRSAAILPNDTYVVKFGPRFVGGVAPANRQNVARWINQIYSNSLPPLSDYLQEAVGYAEGGTPSIMAMDLQHVFAPALIRQKLATLETFADAQADLDEISEVLASIRGVMLGVTVRDSMYGKIKIDFGQDASVLGIHAKPLLLEILAQRGAMIDELKDWTVEINGPQVTIGGVLFDSGLRRIFSVLDAPPGMHAQLQESASASDEETSQKQMAMSTQQYFNSVVSMMDDLRGQRQSSDFTTWGQIGMWFEKYARKVDRLPILNVDPEMLDYGAFVADSLRQAENAMKGIGARSGYRKTQVPNPSAGTGTYAVGGAGWGPYGGGRWGVYGTYGPSNMAQAGNAMRTNMSLKFQAESQIRTQEKIRGNMSANMIVQGVEAATADIRRRMTEKYQMEF